MNYAPNIKLFLKASGFSFRRECLSGTMTRNPGLFEAAAFYMDGLMFATMGASAGSEILLTRAYDKWLNWVGP